MPISYQLSMSSAQTVIIVNVFPLSIVIALSIHLSIKHGDTKIGKKKTQTQSNIHLSRNMLSNYLLCHHSLKI